jgi:MFS family permease
MAFLALQVDVKHRTGSAVWISVLLLAEVVPAIAISLTAGPLVDRLSRRRLMIGADLVRFAIFCALPFAGNATTIVALAFVAGAATGFFRPASYAGLPNLVHADDLPQANSLIQTVENLAVAVAPVLGGVLVSATSPRVVYVINAVSFLVSAAFITRIPGGLLQAVQAASRGWRRDVADGFRIILRSRALLTVLVSWTLAAVALGAINVAEIFLATNSLHSGSIGFGALWGGSGAGMVVGSFLAASWIKRAGAAAAYGASLGLMALGFAGAAASPSIWVAVVCVVVAGFGNGATVVCNGLFVQQGAPDQLRGRAFTVIMSANFVVLSLATFAAGPVTEAVGARWVWGASGALVGLAALVGTAFARGAAELSRLGTTPVAATAVPHAPAHDPSALG